MSRPKGIPKTGGRQKGTPNKRTLELMDVLEAAGYKGGDDDPVVGLWKVASGQITMPVVVTAITEDGLTMTVEDVPLEPALRVKCMAEFAQYLYPKRKAVEVSGTDGGPVQVYFLNLAELEASGVGVVSSE